MSSDLKKYDNGEDRHTLVNTTELDVGYDVLRHAQSIPGWVRSRIEPEPDGGSRTDFVAYFAALEGLEKLFDYIEGAYPHYTEDDGYFFSPIDDWPVE